MHKILVIKTLIINLIALGRIIVIKNLVLSGSLYRLWQIFTLRICFEVRNNSIWNKIKPLIEQDVNVCKEKNKILKFDY